jgi:hypothetical protein
MSTPHHIRRTSINRKGYALRVPERVQRLVLLMPIVRDEMAAQRWAVIVKSANVLLAEGVSLRRSAALLGVPVSSLILRRNQFARGGMAALLRQRPGPRRYHRAERAARIFFATR